MIKRPRFSRIRRGRDCDAQGTQHCGLPLRFSRNTTHGRQRPVAKFSSRPDMQHPTDMAAVHRTLCPAASKFRATTLTVGHPDPASQQTVQMDCTNATNKEFKEKMGIKGFPSFRVSNVSRVVKRALGG